MQWPVEVTDLCHISYRYAPRSNMHVHHIDYDRVGNENFGDLIVICAGCHRMLHKFFDKMVAKGFDRRKVMKKLKPYCVRRLLLIHAIHASHTVYNVNKV